MSISAKIVADSIANNIRITTLELCYQRFIHSEFMTHRVFSRNASSSRAIPIEKMIAAVRSSPARPIHWGKNRSGMQAIEELDQLTGMGLWADTAEYVADNCRIMSEWGYHKQVVNRLLEPFQWIKVIVTATEWDNFFKLRLHPDAQPEMMVLAEHMQAAMKGSTPEELEHGEWHLPYISNDDWCGFSFGNYTIEYLIKFSVARCARVSYLNHDASFPDVEKDIALADRLLKAGHMSPWEHQATPMIVSDATSGEDVLATLNRYKGYTHVDNKGNFWSGNFRGFIQHRQTL